LKLTHYSVARFSQASVTIRGEISSIEWLRMALCGYCYGQSERPGRAVNEMHDLAHWIAMNGGVLAVLVTVGVAVLLVCCLGCTKCGRREKDNLFKHHEL
jgi:hypothetical protein